VIYGLDNPYGIFRSNLLILLMNTKTILGLSLAAVFAVSMMMLPAYAGGHAVVISATAAEKGGSLKLSITTGADIPRFPDALANSVLVFGYAWADLDTGDVVLATIHPTIGRDSHQNPDAWHPHPGVLGQEGQRLSCCLTCCILLPRLGIETVSPALVGRFSTTGPSGKSLIYLNM